MEPTSKQEAKELGFARYFTGKPCINGHVLPRRTRDGACAGCKRKTSLAGYYRNKTKVLAAAKIRHLVKYSPDQDLAWRIKRRGLPEPSRPRPDHCECCGRAPGGNGKRLHFDHDHKTGRFRGWLCSMCNPSIGGLGDCEEGVQKALDYLRRAR